MNNVWILTHIATVLINIVSMPDRKVIILDSIVSISIQIISTRNLFDCIGKRKLFHQKKFTTGSIKAKLKGGEDRPHI
jgi:hypothetical protein